MIYLIRVPKNKNSDTDNSDIFLNHFTSNNAASTQGITENKSERKDWV